MSNLTETESNPLNFIGKENDFESDLSDHGVRKYEPETGRFTAPDPLWASYLGWTPYQYSLNSPLMLVDVGGMLVEVADKKVKDGLINNIEPEYRQYIGFDNNNYVNINISNSDMSNVSENSNFYKLIQMNNSEEVFSIKSVDFSKDKFTIVNEWRTNSNGDKYIGSIHYASLKDIQDEYMWMGKVDGIFLGAENRPITSEYGTFLSPASASGKNEIYIDKKANSKKAVSHEFFEGHAWYYFNGWDHGETNVFGK